MAPPRLITNTQCRYTNWWLYRFLLGYDDDDELLLDELLLELFTEPAAAAGAATASETPPLWAALLDGSGGSPSTGAVARTSAEMPLPRAAPAAAQTGAGAGLAAASTLRW